MIAQTHSTSQDPLAQQWRDSVRIVSGRAGDTLGADFLTRLQKAQDLVLRDCVVPQEDGSYIVTGDSGRDYDVTADFQCPCPDAGRAPELPDSDIPACKHTLAVMLRKRSIQRLQSEMDAKPAVDQREAAVPLPEAPLSINLRGTVRGIPGAQLTVRGSTAAELAQRLDEALALIDPQPQQASNGTNGHKPMASRPVAELTDIPCAQCDQFYWRNWSEDGKQSWLSHRTQTGDWHKQRRS